MEFAVGLTRLGVTALGIIFAYIWRSNGILQRRMMEGIEKITEGIERIEKGQELPQKLIMDGQKLHTEALKSIAEMVLNQTKILERIERRLP